jgi:hypothetical protein
MIHVPNPNDRLRFHHYSVSRPIGLAREGCPRVLHRILSIVVRVLLVRDHMLVCYITSYPP